MQSLSTKVYKNTDTVNETEIKFTYKSTKLNRSKMFTILFRLTNNRWFLQRKDYFPIKNFSCYIISV